MCSWNLLRLVAVCSKKHAIVCCIQSDDAMAALGELLFYGATQVDEDAMEWDIPLSLISTLLKVVKNPN